MQCNYPAEMGENGRHKYSAPTDIALLILCSAGQVEKAALGADNTPVRERYAIFGSLTLPLLADFPLAARARGYYTITKPSCLALKIR